MGKRRDFTDVIIFVLLATVTFFLFGPVSLYLTNINEFWFGIQDVLKICLVIGTVIFVIFCSIGLILQNKKREVFLCLVFGISLGLYIQGNFVMTDYGVLDGTNIDWHQYTSVAIWNTALWVICLMIPFMLRKLIPAWKQILRYISSGILLVEIITLGVIGFTLHSNQYMQNNEYKLTNYGMFELSEDNNLIVFILDCYDSSAFSATLEQNEYLMDSLWKDFVYYPDTVGGATRTVVALPYILTGHPYITENTYAEYLENSFNNAPLYTILKNENYNTGIYTSSTYVSPVIQDQIINMSGGSKEVSSYPVLAYYLYRLTAFRYFPHLLKPYVWLYSGDFDKSLKVEGNDDDPYVFDDALFYQKLKEERITVQNTESSFRIYHLNGAHAPYTLNAQSERVAKSTPLEQQLGVMNILEEYFEQMKEAGIYDTANIIVMADHGEGGIEQNPLFLIKHGAETNKFTISDLPVSYANFQPTLLSLIKENVTDEKSIFELTAEDNKSRYFYYTRTTDQGSFAVEYVVHGPAYNDDNVTATGNSYILYSGKDTEQSKYVLGTTLYFDVRSTGNQYAVSGLSKVEEKHTWSLGSETDFSIPLSETPTGPLFVDFELAMQITKLQRVGVSVNGTFLDNYTVTDNKLAFIIPEHMLVDNEIDIHLEYFDAKSPASLTDTRTDNRILSLGFYSLEIRYILEGDTETPVIPKYSVGDNIVFTAEKDGRQYFRFGISKIETDFAWSLGKSGQISIPFLNDVTNDLTAEFIFTGIYAAPQRFIVRCKGLVLYDAVVESADTPVVFPIPASCVDNRVLLLDLEYPDAISPAERGTSTDERVLAFRFNNIRLFSD